MYYVVTEAERNVLFALPERAARSGYTMLRRQTFPDLRFRRHTLSSKYTQFVNLFTLLSFSSIGKSTVHKLVT